MEKFTVQQPLFLRNSKEIVTDKRGTAQFMFWLAYGLGDVDGNTIWASSRTDLEAFDRTERVLRIESRSHVRASILNPSIR